MKKLFLLVCMASALTITAQNYQKVPDVSEFSLNAIRGVTVHVGQITSGSPTYVKPGFSDDCQSFFDIFYYTPTQDELLTATLISDAGTTCFDCGDTWLAVYETSFNPADPGQNLIVEDDDAGIDCSAAIIPAYNIILNGGTTYVFVNTHFGCTDSCPNGFGYTLTIDTSDAPGEVPVSGWAIALGIGLILVFTLIRFRRF
jgi:hypothetical protein